MDDEDASDEEGVDLDEEVYLDEDDLVERRRTPRVHLDRVVVSFKGGTPRRHRIVDISPQGARLERSKKAPLPPEIHTLELELGEGRTLRVLAKRIWHDERQHAVTFLALDQADRLQIAELIDALARDSKG